MKSFAVSAVVAASASAFDAMAVPDFVAGFIYGMTGDNHLTEIEACYQGGDQIVIDSQTAFGDFKSGNFFKGIKDNKKKCCTYAMHPSKFSSHFQVGILL